MCFGEHLLRPGGTISGPAMFALADVAMYAAVLVLRRAGGACRHHQPHHQLPAQARPARYDRRGAHPKLGKRLAVGEIALHSDGEAELAAHATATYSLPGEWPANVNFPRAFSNIMPPAAGSAVNRTFTHFATGFAGNGAPGALSFRVQR